MEMLVWKPLNCLCLLYEEHNIDFQMPEKQVTTVTCECKILKQSLLEGLGVLPGDSRVMLTFGHSPHPQTFKKTLQTSVTSLEEVSKLPHPEAVCSPWVLHAS